MREIAKRSDIISDAGNLPKVVRRFVGGEYIFFHMIYNSRFMDSIQKLAEYYIGVLKDPESNYRKENLSKFIGDKYKSITSHNSIISNNIKSLKQAVDQSPGVYSKGDYLRILEGLENISRRVYQKVSEMQIECVEDLEILKAKVESLRQIFRSNRYELDKLDYFIDSLTTSSNPENAIRYLTNHYYVRDYKSEILQSIEQAKKILDRF